MAQSVKIRFNAEADFLEVLFSDAPGFMREIEDDAIMEPLDPEITGQMFDNGYSHST